MPTPKSGYFWSFCPAFWPPGGADTGVATGIGFEWGGLLERLRSFGRPVSNSEVFLQMSESGLQSSDTLSLWREGESYAIRVTIWDSFGPPGPSSGSPWTPLKPEWEGVPEKRQVLSPAAARTPVGFRTRCLLGSQNPQLPAVSTRVRTLNSPQILLGVKSLGRL